MRYFKWDKHHLLVKIIAIALVVALAIVLEVSLRRSLSVIESERDIAVSQRDDAVFEQEIAVSQRDELQSSLTLANSERASLQVELDNSTRENWEEAVIAWEMAEVALNTWNQLVLAGMASNFEPLKDVFSNDQKRDYETALEAMGTAFQAMEFAWEATADAWDATAKIWDMYFDMADFAEAAKDTTLKAKSAAEARENHNKAFIDWQSAHSLLVSIMFENLNVASQAPAGDLDITLDISDIAEEVFEKDVTNKYLARKMSGESAWEVVKMAADSFAYVCSLATDIYEDISWQNARDAWRDVADSYEQVTVANTSALDARLTIVNAIKKTRDAYNATAGSEESEGGT